MSKRSVARGDVHALSDIDLLIIADFKDTRRDRVEQILDIAQGLKLTFPVEPLRSDPKSTSRRASAPSSATLSVKRWRFKNDQKRGRATLLTHFIIRVSVHGLTRSHRASCDWVSIPRCSIRLLSCRWLRIGGSVARKTSSVPPSRQRSAAVSDP
jgi:hypothetical protein